MHVTSNAPVQLLLREQLREYQENGQQVVVLIYELTQTPSSVVTAVDRVMGWKDNCTDQV